MLVLGGYLAFLSPEGVFSRFGIGDALVYTRVAFNVAHGKGSTYNLLVPTNGYHPLWMCLHIPFLFGAETIVERMWIIEKFWIFMAVSASFAWSALIRFLTQSDLAAGLTALLFGAFGWSLYVLYSGMETPLVLLALALVFYVATRFRNDGSSVQKRSALLICYAIAAAVSFWARLDSIIVILPTLWFIYPSVLEMRFSKILSATSLFGSLVTPYLLWNMIVIGHPMPVSGLVKTARTIELSRIILMLEAWMARIQRLGISPVWLLVIAVAYCGLVVALSLLLYRSQRLFVYLLAASFMGALAHYGYYWLFMTEIHISWHMYPQFLAAYLSVVGVMVVTEAKLAKFIKNLNCTSWPVLQCLWDL